MAFIIQRNLAGIDEASEMIVSYTVSIYKLMILFPCGWLVLNFINVYLVGGG